MVDPSDFEGLEPQISREEMNRRKSQKGKTYSTSEVLEFLSTLDTQRGNANAQQANRDHLPDSPANIG